MKKYAVLSMDVEDWNHLDYFDKVVDKLHLYYLDTNHSMEGHLLEIHRNTDHLNIPFRKGILSIRNNRLGRLGNIRQDSNQNRPRIHNLQAHNYQHKVG